MPKLESSIKKQIKAHGAYHFNVSTLEESSFVLTFGEDIVIKDSSGLPRLFLSWQEALDFLLDQEEAWFCPYF